MKGRRSAARRLRGMPVAPPPRPIRPLEPLSPIVDRSQWQHQPSALFWVNLWLWMLLLTVIVAAWTIGWLP